MTELSIEELQKIIAKLTADNVALKEANGLLQEKIIELWYEILKLKRL